MVHHVRRYNIEVRGRVQDVGFRGFVENLGKALGLHGSVYNDIDGTVKIVCRGLEDAVDEFLDLMKAKASNVGAVVEDVLKEEIPDKGFIPPTCYIVPADQLSDISRKLDAGINELRGINNRLDAIDGKLDGMDKKLDKLGALEDIKQLLQKIAQKL